MSKKNYIVLSDSGANGCHHYELDTLEEAKELAARRAQDNSLKIEFAIYEKIAVTETIPLKSLLRDVPLKLDVPSKK